MFHTTQGMMTAMDLADYQEQTDTAPNPDCPGHTTDDGTVHCSVADDCPGEPSGEPMDTYKRMAVYLRQRNGGQMTARQRRRVVKKAGRDPGFAVIRDAGMGYSAATQGFKEIEPLPVPVSGGAS